MQKKSLIKSGIVVACLAVASLFGFTVAHGYGGNGGGGSSQPPACTSVVYGEWGACVNGIQSRSIALPTDVYCLITASQQAARTQVCGNGTVTPPTNGGGQVLGVKIYPIGSLLRTSDHKIFVVLSADTVKLIPDLKSLYAYRGHEIFNVSNQVLAQYKQVLGIKIYADGTLLRGPDHKIYVILGGKKRHILDLAELSEYFGHKINNVGADVLAQY